MVGVPNSFLTQLEATPSYQAIDASLGVGYATYYGVDGVSSNFLTPLAADSNTAITTFTVAQSSGHTTPAARIDKDFDITYNFPQILNGKMIVQTSFNMGDGGGSWGAGRTAYCKVNLYVYKVFTDGTEQLLTSDTSTSYSSITAATNLSVRNCFDLTIDNASITVNEKLRLTVQLWAYTTNIGGEVSIITLYHDGSNRNHTASGAGVFSNHDTNLICQVPYKIDI